MTYVQSSYHLRFQRFLLLDWIVRGHCFFPPSNHSYGYNFHFCGSSTVHEASDLLLGGGDSTDSSRDNARASLQTRKKILALQHAVAAPERAPFPVIAAVHGHVIGLGVDLISACDIRYAASNSAFSVKVWEGALTNFLLASKLFIGSRYWFSPRRWFSFLSPKSHGQSISYPRTHLYRTSILC